MFTKILIANRGEIACRVIRTAKRLGIKTVAVYSDADEQALHTKSADEAIYVGASPSSESYLLGDRIIEAALKTGAQAIHPGYGFLSENAGFANACAKNNLIFIGPPAKSIEAMGSKSAAKIIMETAGVPLVPGYHGDDQSAATLKQAADEMGYPVLLKAVAGGGGKGMRQVWSADEFAQAFDDAKRESNASFGNDDMLVEKYLTEPRHVEVQVFCDQHGNGVYLFERDCSVQRRHQKIIEEAPAPNLSLAQREAMGETAVQAAQAIDYQGAGTVEFLFDTDGSFYFMEMNTRLQVEHPVTEMITGQDLVEWQLNVANGLVLPLQQSELAINGHSFEARIYAEDPDNDFLPTTGTLTRLITPKTSVNVRVDTGVVQGDEVSPFYDPMIAKLVVWDEDRSRALSRLTAALREYQITGLTTNIDFLHRLVSSEPFVNAELDTGFIETHQDALFDKIDVDIEAALARAGLFLVLNSKTKAGSDPWHARDGWRMNQARAHRYDIQLNDECYRVELAEIREPNSYKITIDDNVIEATARLDGTLNSTRLICTIDGHRQSFSVSQNTLASHGVFEIHGERGSIKYALKQSDIGDEQTGAAQHDFAAPMNGRIIDILVHSGDDVSQGQPLIIMEAMKMQHTLQAPTDGTVTELFCKVGDLVDGGAQLLKFDASDPISKTDVEIGNKTSGGAA